MDESSKKRIEFLANLKPGAHVHLAGICGTGMAGIATLFKERGFYVSGSDKAFYPPMGDVVRRVADKIYEGYAAENLKDVPALVVIGNTIRRDNPEAQLVMENGIPFVSMPEVLGGVLIGTKSNCENSVVVAGTHGKTTTSALIATMLDVAGRKPGYFIGGVPTSLPGSIRAVDQSIEVSKRAVVLEGDEYDSAFFAKVPKFLSYRTDIGIITSVEFDHADIYSSLEQIEAQFELFAAQVLPGGTLLVADSTEHLVALAERWQKAGKIRAKLCFYGEKQNSSFRLVSRTPLQGGGQELKLLLQGKMLTVRTTLSGSHNAYNILVGAAVGSLLGVEDEKIAAGLAKFTGVKRRQQVLLNKNGVTLIEDFAHHPTAVSQTLAGLKENYPGKRLIAVFEPRSNTSRRSFFQTEYAKSFDAADLVTILEVADAGDYNATGQAMEVLNVKQLVEAINSRGVKASSFVDIASLKEFVLKTTTSGDVVVLMSNGDFGGLPQTLSKELAAR